MNTELLNSRFERLSAAYEDLDAPLHVRDAAKVITISFPKYSIFWGEKDFGKYIEWSNGQEHAITLDF